MLDFGVAIYLVGELVLISNIGRDSLVLKL